MITLSNILQKKAPELLYHYTTQHGLLGIAEAKAIWASKIQYLNDTQEYTLALELARNTLTELKQRASTQAQAQLADQMISHLKRFEMVNIFVCSFSEREDLLSQWRGYCPDGSGFSLGFNANKLKIIAEKQSFFLAPCIYDSKIQIKIVREIVHSAMNKLAKQHPVSQIAMTAKICTEFVGILGTYAPMIKHDSFEEEKEWRLISYPISKDDPNLSCRPGKSTIIPHFSLNLADDLGVFEISDIIVGPTSHKDLAIDAIGFLSRFGVKGNSVRNSRVPYRNW